MAKRILVIDDNEDILEILNIVFQDAGYQVVLSNTADAAEHIDEIAPDLVLLDIRIAGSEKTGVDICTELKAHPGKKNLPVILISAEADTGILSQLCGADAYVNKPFDLNRLLVKVKEFIA